MHLIIYFLVTFSWSSSVELGNMYEEETDERGIQAANIDQQEKSDYMCTMYGSFPNPEDCGNYFQCTQLSGYASVKYCGLSYHFDALKKKCIRKKIARCALQICNRETGDVVKANDKNQYYHCDEGIPKIRSCGNLVFDKTEKKCIKPDEESYYYYY